MRNIFLNLTVHTKKWGMIKIAAVVITIVIVITSVLIVEERVTSIQGILPGNGNENSTARNVTNPSPFLTLSANRINPSVYGNFTYGYMDPNLWNLKFGNGNVKMFAYANSSIHTVVSLSSVAGGYDVLGYPSVHFTYDIPMSLGTAYADNLSSFVSFNIVNITQKTPLDIAYDLFLGQSSILQAEVMIMLYSNARPIKDGSFNASATVDGSMQSINWVLNVGHSASGNFSSYMFFPSVPMDRSANYTISFVPFLRYLQNESYINSSLSILRIGIGSEFGSWYSYVFYSFWMYSYFILNGTEYQVVQK